MVCVPVNQRNARYIACFYEIHIVVYSTIAANYTVIIRGHGNESCNYISSQPGPDFPIADHGHGNAQAMCCPRAAVLVFLAYKPPGRHIYTTLAKSREHFATSFCKENCYTA